MLRRLLAVGCVVASAIAAACGDQGEPASPVSNAVPAAGLVPDAGTDATAVAADGSAIDAATDASPVTDGAGPGD